MVNPLAETGTNNSADRDAWFHGDQSGFGTDPRRQFIGSGGTESPETAPIWTRSPHKSPMASNRRRYVEPIHRGCRYRQHPIKSRMFGRFSNWLGTETNIGIMFTMSLSPKSTTPPCVTRCAPTRITDCSRGYTPASDGLRQRARCRGNWAIPPRHRFLPAR
jgi:hypothetical protein